MFLILNLIPSECVQIVYTLLYKIKWILICTIAILLSTLLNTDRQE